LFYQLFPPGDEGGSFPIGFLSVPCALSGWSASDFHQMLTFL
jgi:hypothetical protein